MREESPKKLHNRYNVVAVFLLAVASVYIVQLLNLQIINGEKYYEQSQNNQLNSSEVVASRGNIIDRYGSPIAINRSSYNVQIVKTKLKNDELNQNLLKLIKVFEKNNDTYQKSFSKLMTLTPLNFGTKYDGSNNKLEKLKKDLKQELGLRPQKLDTISNLGDLFLYLRKDVFKINAAYNDEDAYKIICVRYEIRNYTEVSPATIAKDVDKKTIAEIEEKHDEFPGIAISIEPLRKYVDGPAAAHVTGYIGNISEEQYKKKKDQGYGMNDLIGHSGVELAAENYLHGKNGLSTLQIDKDGRQTGEYVSIPAVPGNDVQLTLDMRLQKVAAESLEKQIKQIRSDVWQKGNYGDAFAGAVVAMDVSNGDILAMASYPTYDPSIFTAGPNDKEAQQEKADLFDKKNILLAPMMNRAISGIYAPGSTFKPIVGIAGLEEGVITPKTLITDNGYMYIDGVKLTCMEYRHGYPAHGDLTLERALATSCNIFFHELGRRTGIDYIDKWAEYFGLGQKTGIDVDSSAESSGVLASKAYKRTLTRDIWGQLDTAQVAIGQLYNAFTPLQLANYASTIANGGKKYTPHLIKRVISPDGTVISETKPQFTQTPVKKETINAVKQGMIAVTNATDGTAVEIFNDLPFMVAGKTGTAETGEQNVSNNGVFICYAPANPDQTPKIAIAIVIQRGVFGKFTAPIAHDILKEYFNLNNISSFNKSVETDNPYLIR